LRREQQRRSSDLRDISHAPGNIDEKLDAKAHRRGKSIDHHAKEERNDIFPVTAWTE